MYIPATVKCDSCGKFHNELNGWFSVVLRGDDELEAIIIRPFSQDNEREPAVCGEACLHVLISQNLGKLHER